MIRVLRVLAPNAGPFTLEGTNTWIVGERPSVVVDPGPDDPGHLLGIVDEAEPVGAIVLTHRHPDHAEGASRLAEVTGAPVYAFRPEEGERRLRDGDAVHAGDATIRAVHTPGHSGDHLSFLVPDERLLMTGDAVLGRGSSVIDPPEGDMAAYVRSLRIMLDLGPRTIYPGHGPVVFDAPRRLREYLDHRAEREASIVAALQAGPSTPDEIAQAVYGDEVPTEMLPAAARSVLAHLVKLEREDRVARAGRSREDRFELLATKPCERCGRPARPGSRYCRRCAVAVLQEGIPPPSPKEEAEPPTPASGEGAE
jgi:glyoxylase-like metal-dependent hydrolase (beta-lactamase superfamily II)